MRKPHALIVDDDVQSRKILAELLSRQGMTITEVGDPSLVLQIIQQQIEIDVIFLDLKMPNLSGFRVKDLLNLHLGNVPIIAYSAHTDEIYRAKQLGFNGFLSKPLRIEHFPDQLARILRSDPVWE